MSVDVEAVFETPIRREMAGFRYYERTSPRRTVFELQKRVQVYAASR